MFSRSVRLVLSVTDILFHASSDDCDTMVILEHHLYPRSTKNKKSVVFYTENEVKITLVA
jgi:hypothetical protein